MLFAQSHTDNLEHTGTTMMRLSEFSCQVVLRNGSSLLIRAIRSDDKQRLVDGFRRLTAKSIFFRFFSAKKGLTEKELKYFTEIDFEHHVAIVATMMSKGRENIIGVGRYIESKIKGPERVAEIALAVDDEHQHLGIGTILFEQIVTFARNCGISRLKANVLLENEIMLRICQNSGFKLETSRRHNMLHIEFSIIDPR